MQHCAGIVTGGVSMEIRIIKNSPGVVYEPVTEGIVLQITEGRHRLGELHSNKYELFSVNSNEKEEIEPDIPKYHLWDIVTLVRPRAYIYFTSCSMKDKGRVEVNFYRYSWEQKGTELIYTVTDDLFLYPEQKKTRVYVLDENYLLFQNMYLKTNSMENYQGFHDFELTLYSIREKKSFVITDHYLLQAGISFMAPMGKNICAIKTGYNLLKNNGFQYLNDAETVVENIGFINTKQMISDILLKQKNIYIDIIDQVKADKTIPAYRVEGDYLIYSRVSREGSEEVIFYHYPDKEVDACVFSNVHKIEELSTPWLLKGAPCVLLEGRKSAQLYNLKKEKPEFIFGNDTRVKKIFEDFIIVETRHKRKLFKHAYSAVQVFQYKDRSLLINEKGSFGAALAPDDKTLYLFIR